MTIKPLKQDGRVIGYVARWRQDGNPNPKKLTARIVGDMTAAECRKALEAEVNESRRKARYGLKAADGKLILRKFFEETYLPAAEIELAPRTLAVYRALWRAHVDRPPVKGWPFSSSLADMAVTEISADTLDEYRNALLRAGVGRQSVRKTLVLLSAVLRKALKTRLIEANPMGQVDLPSGARQVFPVVLAPEKVETLRHLLLSTTEYPVVEGTRHYGPENVRRYDESKARWCETHDRRCYVVPRVVTFKPCERARRMSALLVEVLAYVGVRPEEALRLTWSDVHDRTIDVIGQTKTGTIRAVEVPEVVIEDLREWRKETMTSLYVFSMTGGKPWSESAYRNWRSRVFKPFAQKLSDEISEPKIAGARVYDLRHSCASLRLRDPNYTLREVADDMGHDQETLSRIYGHVIKELKGLPPLPMDDQIRLARRRVSGDDAREAI